MDLPPPLAAYFSATNAFQAGAAAEAFTAGATVSDEGQDHHGRAEIEGWIAEAIGKYHAVAEPLELKEDGNALLVTARVSGDFPGSPIELDYRFTLEGGKIASLRIE